MKIKFLLTAALASFSLLISPVYAVPENNKDRTNDIVKKIQTTGERFEIKRNGTTRGSYDKCVKDPIKMLEEKKAEIQEKLKEGKITKEKADELTIKIDERIKEIKEFDKLTTEQKKEKLIKKFDEVMDKKIKEGRITKEEAEILKKEFNEKIKNWDGKGYPRFRIKRPQ